MEQMSYATIGNPYAIATCSYNIVIIMTSGLITDIIIIGIIDVTHCLFIMCPHAHAALNSFTNKLDRRVKAVNDLAAMISSGKLQAKPRIESTLSTSTPPPKAPNWTVTHTYIQTPVHRPPNNKTLVL